MEYYSTVNKNEIMKFASKWIELEKMMLNEVTQIQKNKHCTISPIANCQVFRCEDIPWSNYKKKESDHWECLRELLD